MESRRDRITRWKYKKGKMEYGKGKLEAKIYLRKENSRRPQ